MLKYIKWIKPAFLLGNFARGFMNGSLDEIRQTFTDAEILRFKDKNHLKEEAYSEINKALRKKKESHRLNKS